MKYVSYLRVSRESQGAEGNGIEAQRKAVQEFAAAEGSIIVREFIEVESGSDNERPVMKEAVQWAEMTGSVLLVKTLDRISRDLHFITALEKAEVAFRIVDMPTADSFTLHIYGSLAQRERELISIRTKAALKSLRERGTTKSGAVYVPGKAENFSSEGRAKGANVSAAVRTAKATNFNSLVAPMIAKYRSENLSFAKIADKLNAEGLLTRRGGEWSAVTVSRICEA